MGEMESGALNAKERMSLRHYQELLIVHLGLDLDTVEKMPPEERSAAFREAIQGKGNRRTVLEQLTAAPEPAVKMGGRDVAIRPLPFKAAFEWRQLMATKVGELAQMRQVIVAAGDEATLAKASFDLMNQQDQMTAELLEAYLKVMPGGVNAGAGAIPEAATMEEINTAWEVASGLACPFLKNITDALQGQIRTDQTGS